MFLKVRRLYFGWSSMSYIFFWGKVTERVSEVDYRSDHLHFGLPSLSSIADPDPGSGAFLTSGPGIGDGYPMNQDPGSEKPRNSFLS